MLDRLSDDARRVMGFARKEAIRFNHAAIGTEHILLGIVAEDCAASSALEAMGVSAAKIRGAVEHRLRPGAKTIANGALPFAPRGKRALELATEEGGTDNGSVDTTHLLLGLLREDGWGAAGILKDLGVTLDKLRAHLGTPSEAPKTVQSPAPKVIGELKEGMRVFFKQPGGTKNTLEISVANGILHITDRAKDARVQVVTVIRPGVRHAFSVYSWSEPPKPEIEPP